MINNILLYRPDNPKERKTVLKPWKPVRTGHILKVAAATHSIAFICVFQDVRFLHTVEEKVLYKLNKHYMNRKHFPG